ncbi:MAG: right-handed parallel beta-helix repeat-containing protein [Methylococcaceae bacterium]
MNSTSVPRIVHENEVKFSTLSTCLKIFAAIASIALQSPVFCAAVQTISIKTNDQSIFENGSERWGGQKNSRVGSGYGESKSSVFVLPFKIPVLISGEEFNVASLILKMGGWFNFNQLNNVDLYGLNTWSATSLVSPNTNFIDKTDPGTNDSAFLLQDNSFTPSDIYNTTASGQKIAKTSTDFSSYVPGLYSSANNATKLTALSVESSSSGGSKDHPVEGSTPTLWVDGSTTGKEKGSQANPYDTIQEAINVAAGGDIIRVQGGTYFESLSFQKKFSSSAPLILEGAPGEVVELSGAVPLKGWVGPNKSGIYTLKTNQIVNELLVGDKRMPAARWPDINDGLWPSITAIDKVNDTVSITGPLPPVKNLTSNIKNLQAYLYVKGSNIFDTIFITGVTSGSTNKVKLVTSEFKTIENNQPTHLLFVNHPDLINRPGEWASVKLSGGKRRIYFKPRTTADLQTTNTRKLSHGLNFGSQAPSHVTVRGLNVKSFRDSGANISQGASHITLEDLVIYNVGRKEVWGIGGSGISIRDANDITVRRSVAAMNSRGISVHSSTNVVIDQCEVGKNDEDGIFALGDGPVKNTRAVDGTVNLQVSNSYVHHHLYQGHPDNIQYTSGVYNSTLDKVLAMYSGQNFISADTFNSSLINSTFVGSGAINVIVGKKTYPDDKFNIIDNSFLFSRFQSGLSIIAKNPVLSGNIIYGLEVSNDIPPKGQLFTSDYNLYWEAGTGVSSLWTLLQPKFQTFKTLSSFTAHTGEDEHSRQANPLLANVPKMVNLVAGLGVSSSNRLVLLLQAGNDVTDYYSVGNKVEVNGDGVARDVTAVTDNAISINPPLPEAPFRITLVANWGTKADLQMNTLPLAGSPALGSGQKGFDIGADINIYEYQAGDFNGDGIRDIPSYPAEVGYQLSHPNEYTDPFVVLP